MTERMPSSIWMMPARTKAKSRIAEMGLASSARAIYSNLVAAIAIAVAGAFG